MTSQSSNPIQHRRFPIASRLSRDLEITFNSVFMWAISTVRGANSSAQIRRPGFVASLDNTINVLIWQFRWLGREWCPEEGYPTSYRHQVCSSHYPSKPRLCHYRPGIRPIVRTICEYLSFAHNKSFTLEINIVIIEITAAMGFFLLITGYKLLRYVW